MITVIITTINDWSSNSALYEWLAQARDTSPRLTTFRDSYCPRHQCSKLWSSVFSSFPLSAIIIEMCKIWVLSLEEESESEGMLPSDEVSEYAQSCVLLWPIATKTFPSKQLVWWGLQRTEKNCQRGWERPFSGMVYLKEKSTNTAIYTARY